MTEPGPLVLVIDDNEPNLLLTRMVLVRAGFEVLTAGTAEEGLELATGRLPAIVLTDIQLPGMDGIELARRLTAETRTAAIPVVALSAHAMKVEERLALEAGCRGFIRKPIDTRVLADQVRLYLKAEAS